MDDAAVKAGWCPRRSGAGNTNAPMMLMAKRRLDGQTQPAQHQQRQIDQPHENGPDHLGVRPVARVRGTRQVSAGGEADGEQNEPGEHQPAGDDFQPLNRRQRATARRGVCGISSRAAASETFPPPPRRGRTRRTPAEWSPRADWSARRKIAASGRAAGRARHQRKHADGEQHRRRKRAEKSQPRQQADDEVGGDERSTR